MKESSCKDGGDWLEPALNTYAPLFPTLTPVLLFATFQNGNKNYSWDEKILEGHLPPPPPPSYASSTGCSCWGLNIFSVNFSMRFLHVLNL